VIPSIAKSLSRHSMNACLQWLVAAEQTAKPHKFRLLGRENRHTKKFSFSPKIRKKLKILYFKKFRGKFELLSTCNFFREIFAAASQKIATSCLLLSQPTTSCVNANDILRLGYSRPTGSVRTE